MQAFSTALVGTSFQLAARDSGQRPQSFLSLAERSDPQIMSMHKALSVKSRVRGDFHARFCERVRVKLPRSTRPCPFLPSSYGRLYRPTLQSGRMGLVNVPICIRITIKNCIDIIIAISHFVLCICPSMSFVSSSFIGTTTSVFCIIIIFNSIVY